MTHYLHHMTVKMAATLKVFMFSLAILLANLQLSCSRYTQKSWQLRKGRFVESFKKSIDYERPYFTSKPEKFVVNLDKPATDRWTHIVTRKPYSGLVPKLTEAIKSYVPDEIFPLVEEFTAKLDSHVSMPYSDEMKGIAKALNVPLGDVVGANFLYDFTAFCTSIVLQDDQGKIWHVRNLDYTLSPILRNMTIAVDFKRNNETVYSGVTFVGYVGLLTGQRPKAFTLTLNERDDGGWWSDLLEFLLHYKSLTPVGFLMRDTLAQAGTYTEAIQQITSTTTESSVYIIVGGIQKNEGVVITKGREFLVDLWRLDAPEGWFVIETNYDHWVPPPVSDNRRVAGIVYMNTMGSSNVTVSSLFKVMSYDPVLNSETVYTTVMSASQPDLMETWVWHGTV